MSSALYLIERYLKAIKKVDMSTYILLFIVLITNLYGLYSTILGKMISLLSVIYLILNNNVTFGIIAFLLVLLLNNGTVENFENNGENDSKTNSKIDETTIDPSSENSSNRAIKESETTVELNDTIATFKTQHCKNGKLVDKDGKEINVSDLSNVFPNIKFNIENEKCNPCDDNCGFKITSDVERITVEEKLRPTSSTEISSN